MVVSLARSDLEDVLERAVRDARAPKASLDRRWTARIGWLSREVAGGDAKGKTYIAATGAALLAKATNDTVDTLTQSGKGGPRGYGLRGVAELMQTRVRGTVHLGTLSKWPMNNAPFLRGPARIDRFTIAGYLQHVYDEYLSWMQELDGYSSEQAYQALVAFLAVRIKAQREENAALAAGTRMTAARSIVDLLDGVQLWLTEDPEEGARGQALLAAVLDLVWDDVELVPKHHPAPFDVRRGGSPSPLVCESKQQRVTAAEALDLARRAAEHDSDLALYAALAQDQPPLAAERLRAQALDHHGVLFDVVHDTRELVTRIAVHGGVPAAEVAAGLPQSLADRCPAAGVSNGGLRRLQGLLQVPGR
jgi:hypothetical protein